MPKQLTLFCLLCGSGLQVIKEKLVCAGCGRVSEGCCEGEPCGVS